MLIVCFCVCVSNSTGGQVHKRHWFIPIFGGRCQDGQQVAGLVSKDCDCILSSGSNTLIGTRDELVLGEAEQNAPEFGSKQRYLPLLSFVFTGFIQSDLFAPRTPLTLDQRFAPALDKSQCFSAKNNFLDISRSIPREQSGKRERQ